jgi:hypothetical protein
LVAVLAACGGGKRSTVDKALDALAGFKDRGCACKDAACFAEVQGQMEVWARAHAKELNGARATPAQGKRAETIDREMIACQEKFGIPTRDHERAQQMVRELRGFQVQYCACPDMDCVAIVDAAMKQWATSRANEIKKLKPTKAQDDEAAGLEKEIKECIARIKAQKPPDPSTQILAKMNQLMVQMCACADAACADTVNAELMTLHPPPDQKDVVDQVMGKMKKCEAKARAASATPP